MNPDPNQEIAFTMEDHDAIMRIKNVEVILADHEIRIRKNEGFRNYIIGALIILNALLGVLAGGLV